MSKEYKAPPELMKFFKKIMDLKVFVKKEMESSDDPILKEIYERLDDAIKVDSISKS